MAKFRVGDVVNKQIVTYVPSSDTFIEVGKGALVRPINHQSDLVSNTQLVITSPVLKLETCGKFETHNTIYVVG